MAGECKIPEKVHFYTHIYTCVKHTPKVVIFHFRYYECCVSKLPTNCIPSEIPLSNVTIVAAAALLRQENVQHQAASQMISLSILGVGVAIFALGNCMIIIDHE